MVLFGRTKNPYFQEYWNGKPVIGILNPDNNYRGAKEFRERITAVVFIPEKNIQLLDRAFLLLNESRAETHLRALWSKLKDIPALKKLKYVPSPQ
ncbi:MAG TPA: hypothetical protein VL197_02995 [Nitrospirota bacterium]|nr:hypothetical protein [Nitrospirota bacterium]